MHGEIFCLDDQESEVPFLKGLLRRHVYAATRVTVHRLGSPEKWSTTRVAADRYSKLLQAAIPPRTALRVYPKEFTPTGAMYIEILYRGFGARSFFQKDFESFFPAIALHDRMCIVPQNLAVLLGDEARDTAPFRTIGNAGVLPADFSDDAAIESAIVEVGKQIRAEVTSELAAYASYNKTWDVDIAKVAGFLDADPGYLIHCLQAGAIDRATGLHLECRLDKTSIEPENWTKATLMVSNKSNESMNGAELIVSGPFKIRPGRPYIDIAANATTNFSLAIMPLERGAQPLELTFATPVDRPFSEWLQPHHIWLECGLRNVEPSRAAKRVRNNSAKTKRRAASAR